MIVFPGIYQKKNGQDTSPLLYLHRQEALTALAPRRRGRRPWAIRVLGAPSDGHDGEKNLENHGKMMIEPKK